jgi:hypothetical protein
MRLLRFLVGEIAAAQKRIRASLSLIDVMLAKAGRLHPGVSYKAVGRVRSRIPPKGVSVCGRSEYRAGSPAVASSPRGSRTRGPPLDLSLLSFFGRPEMSRAQPLSPGIVLGLIRWRSASRRQSGGGWSSECLCRRERLGGPGTAGGEVLTRRACGRRLCPRRRVSGGTGTAGPSRRDSREGDGSEVRSTLGTCTRSTRATTRK